ncbi:hypothetical protein AAES_122463 [Amazona aestiva]|uniref:Uncharacterized protein n=1 Tax=Amazona aestiva TaxID=12930 RepID=A0A0Q3PNY0_AMAAE|nr:hypothetical protein AAES_122463 [Amazona aestiva]
MEPPVSQPQEQPPRPRSHTVTTTSSSFTANLSASSSTLAYDREFLRTLPGLLMVTEICEDVLFLANSKELKEVSDVDELILGFDYVFERMEDGFNSKVKAIRQAPQKQSIARYCL